MAQQNPSFIEEARKIDPSFYLLIGGVVGFLLAAIVFNSDSAFMSEFVSGINPKDLAPEIVGITVTVLILDRLAERRAHHREEQQEKERLIRQLGSTVNHEVIRAVEELRENKCLFNGSLNGAYLHLANLENAKLYKANLQRADLFRANLKEAVLQEANLMGASLWNATLEGGYLSQINLRGANIVEANLTGATLSDALLESANLWLANLSGAYLQRANLSTARLEMANLSGSYLSETNFKGADLSKAILAGVVLERLHDSKICYPVFDEGTILPDGTNWADTAEVKQKLANWTGREYMGFQPQINAEVKKPY